MSTATTTARVRLALEGANTVTKGLDGVDQKVRAVGQTLLAIGGGVSFTALAGKLVAVQREFDVLNSSLITVTGSNAAAAREFAWIKEFAATTPFQLNEVTGAFVKMKALGLDASQKALASYGNTASAMGKDLNQMIEAVADAATGEFERLKEFGIKAKQQGDSVTLTFQGVSTTIGKNAEEITQYLQAIGNNQFAGAMATRAATLDGAISNLADSWDELFRTVNDAGVGALMASSVSTASAALSGLSGMIRENREEIEILSGVLAGGAMLAVLPKLAAGLGAVALGVRAIGVALAANPATMALLGVGAVVGGLAAYDNAYRKTAEGMKKTIEQMEAANRQAAEGLHGRFLRPEIVRDVNEAIADRTKKINELKKALAAMSAPVGSVGSGDTALLRAQGVLSAEAAAKAAARGADAKESARAAARIGSNTLAAKALAAAEKEIADIRRNDLSVGEQRNKQAEKNFEIHQKLLADAAELNAQFLAGYQQQADSAQQRLTDMQQENEAQALATSMQISMAEAVELTAIARLREQQVAVMGNEAAVLAIEQEIEARQHLAGLIGSTERAAAERKAQQEMLDFWKEVDSTAQDLVYDLAVNGEDAFKRWGQALEREVYNMLWQMTARKWIFQISGVDVGGGGGTDWIGMAKKAYDYYTGGAAAPAASSASAIANGMTQAEMLAAQEAGMGAQAVSTGYGAAAQAASTYGTSIASQQTAMLAAQEAGMSTAASSTASASASSLGWMSYAALIAAAVMVAENLYEKGYTRAALGRGSETVAFGGSNYTSDPGMSRSRIYDISPENAMRNVYDAIGVSEKWADLLSGSVKLAPILGRKLSAYGYQADIAGGEAEISGFARYKGAVRGNKTIAIDVDPAGAAEIDRQVESMIEGARAMARAMGLNENAIDDYTGSLRINFKGTRTAQEQAERLNEELENMHYTLLNAASGGKIAREEFEKMRAEAEEAAAASGISAQTINDVLINGMMNGLGSEQTGAQMADLIAGGIVHALAQSYTQQIASMFMSQIITPIFTAIMAGVPIAQAVNKQSIDAMVAYAEDTAEALNQMLNTPELMEAINAIGGAASRIGAAFGAVRTPNIRGMAAYNAATERANAAAQRAAEVARERETLELALLRVQGNTAELRRRELEALHPSNRALQRQIWALEEQQAAAEEAARAAEELKDTWGSVMDSMSSELRALRDEILGLTPNATAWGLSDLATAQAAAMAGDVSAAERIPEIARAVLDLAAQTSASLSDLRGVQGYVFGVLERTQGFAAATAGLSVPAFAVGTNFVPRDMLAQIHQGEAIVPRAYNPAAGGALSGAGADKVVGAINALKAEVTALKGITLAQAGTIVRLQTQFDEVTEGGTRMRSKAVTV